MKIQNLQNVMVSISVLKTMAGDLVKAGFTRVYRTKTQQAELTALYEAKAKENTPNLDPLRLGRTDAAGNEQADGGYLIFTAQGQKMVTPSGLVADLTKFGFHLVVIEIFQREGDEEHIKLRLTWSRNTQAFTILDDRHKKVVRKYFDLVYHKLFGFNNPESVGLEGDHRPISGSITTLNFSGVMKAEQVKTCAGQIREVRMTDADGHLACPLRNPAAKTAPNTRRCPERPARAPDWRPGGEAEATVSATIKATATSAMVAEAFDNRRRDDRGGDVPKFTDLTEIEPGGGSLGNGHCFH